QSARARSFDMSPRSLQRSGVVHTTRTARSARWWMQARDAAAVNQVLEAVARDRRTGAESAELERALHRSPRAAHAHREASGHIGRSLLCASSQDQPDAAAIVQGAR